jgi:hypothetical protein
MPRTRSRLPALEQQDESVDGLLYTIWQSIGQEAFASYICKIIETYFCMLLCAFVLSTAPYTRSVIVKTFRWLPQSHDNLFLRPVSTLRAPGWSDARCFVYGTANHIDLSSYLLSHSACSPKSVYTIGSWKFPFHLISIIPVDVPHTAALQGRSYSVAQNRLMVFNGRILDWTFPWLNTVQKYGLLSHGVHSITKHDFEHSPTNMTVVRLCM